MKEKMRSVAAYLGELNEKNEVKGYSKNNYGHAKVIQVKPGCSVWVHHTFENSLIIDLLISPNAQKKYSHKCDGAVEKFKAFFDNVPKKEAWYHADKPDVEHDMYPVDVTDKDEQEIFTVLSELKKTMRSNV